jgi:hypothetical protein
MLIYILAGCQYMFVIDDCTRAPNHLDISTAAGPAIVGSDTGFWNDITKDIVSQTFCENFWTGEMHPNAGPEAKNAPLLLAFESMKKGTGSGAPAAGPPSPLPASPATSATTTSTATLKRTTQITLMRTEIKTGPSQKLELQTSSKLPVYAHQAAASSGTQQSAATSTALATGNLSTQVNGSATYHQGTLPAQVTTSSSPACHIVDAAIVLTGVAISFFVFL